MTVAGTPWWFVGYHSLTLSYAATRWRGAGGWDRRWSPADCTALGQHCYL